MVADIDERMPADEFWGWVCYLNAARGGAATGKDKPQPKTAEGWIEMLRGMGHDVKGGA